MAHDTFPQTYVLRGGPEVVLQPLRPGDMPALQVFYRALPEEERMVLKDDVTTPEWAHRFQQRLVSGEVVSLVALVDNQVVGESTLYRAFSGWMRHVGEIRIAVRQDCRRKGLGTTMAGHLVRIATDLGIEKIIVQVVENQVGARKTFEKLGFHKEAVLPHHVMDLSGIKRDLLVMANDVSRIWAAMEALNMDAPLHMGD